MKSVPQRPFGAFVRYAAAATTLAGACMSAHADKDAGWLSRTMGEGHWRAAVSPYSHHFRPSDEHRHVWAVGLEWQRNDNWLAGASYFRNSFGQPSSYLYVGKRWTSLLGQPSLFAQLSGGLLYGYRGKYEDKVPFNNNGFSPGALASLGWQVNKQFAVTGHLLGDAALMVQLSYDFR